MTNTGADRLLGHLLEGGGEHPRLSVIGLSKNAGKTVTLNHIIRAASRRGLVLGIVSSGRDGEEKDAVTELPKPRIWVPEGAWIATARAALPAGSAGFRVVRELSHSTPFGRVVVGQTETPGDVLLIGPGSASRIGDLLEMVESHGANLCLVDGSFDRIAAAAPAVTGRVVLAAGAAYSSAMGETVAQVRHVLDLFDLPPVPSNSELLVQSAARTGSVTLIDAQSRVIPLPVTSALSDPEPIVEAAAIVGSGARLVLAGALSDRLLASLVNRRIYDVELVLNDPTHVLVSRALWRRWRGQGGRAYVRRPIKLLAVTTNAHSPVGRDYDPGAFFAEVAAIAGRPVFDLETGLSLPD